MPVDLSIEGAPDEVVDRLRQRAARNHRSLQGELVAIIEAASREDRPARLTVSEIMREAKRLGVAQVNEAADMIREDRDGRRLATGGPLAPTAEN